jgi:ribonuclease HI
MSTTNIKPNKTKVKIAGYIDWNNRPKSIEQFEPLTDIDTAIADLKLTPEKWEELKEWGDEDNFTRYEISSQGNIRRIDRDNIYPVGTWVNANGIALVNLPPLDKRRRETSTQSLTVRSLIYRAFQIEERKYMSYEVSTDLEQEQSDEREIYPPGTAKGANLWKEQLPERRSSMKEVTLITDGACVRNPGPGGWAFILRYGEHCKEGFGGTCETTNNRMEITAAIEGLKALKEPCEVRLISDSQYLINGIMNWRFKWRDKAWMRKPKKGQQRPVLNPDLWQELDALANTHTIRGEWVRGHSGHADNERCDQLAEAEAARHADLRRGSARTLAI